MCKKVCTFILKDTFIEDWKTVNIWSAIETYFEVKQHTWQPISIFKTAASLKQLLANIPIW